MRYVFSWQLFQSTFPRGERHRGFLIREIDDDFNPRSRVGNDEEGKKERKEEYNISIHVPAWGTTICIVIIADSIVFQSTFPRGERRYAGIYRKIHEPFQSTFPRGERPGRGNQKITKQHFNPRSRVGNDDRRFRKGYMASISIHVPAWGTTANFNNFSLIYSYK